MGRVRSKGPCGLLRLKFGLHIIIAWIIFGVFRAFKKLIIILRLMWRVFSACSREFLLLKGMGLDHKSPWFDATKIWSSYYARPNYSGVLWDTPRIYSHFWHYSSSSCRGSWRSPPPKGTPPRGGALWGLHFSTAIFLLPELLWGAFGRNRNFRAFFTPSGHAPPSAPPMGSQPARHNPPQKISPA